MHLATILAMAGILDAASAPGFFTFETLGFLLFCIILGTAWLVRFGIFIFTIRHHGRFHRSFKMEWRPWVAEPLIAAITLSLVFFEVPLRLRFAISRNDLNRLSQQALISGPSPLTPNWSFFRVQKAGAFNVMVVQVTSDGEVDFRVPGTEFFRSYSGFSYRPTGNPSDPEGSFEPLGGPWYVWHTSW